MFSISRYDPGVESEHNSTGTCVTEQGAECKVLTNHSSLFYLLTNHSPLC